ncbi:MAG: hypothetical protein U5Q44_05730 [Dehalococcoidia bacterium]|nr:hypothetical protein [Dehalococcoidia bacterium]
MWGDRFAVFGRDLPELFGELAVVVPAGLGDFEADGAVGAVSVGRERVGAEDKAGRRGIVLFQPAEERGDHAAADATAAVFLRDVDAPDVEAGFVAKVDGEAADGDAVLDGDEVAMRAGLVGVAKHAGSFDGVGQVSHVEGVVGEATLAPASHLPEEVTVPGPQLKAIAGDGSGVGSRCHW